MGRRLLVRLRRIVSLDAVQVPGPRLLNNRLCYVGLQHRRINRMSYSGQLGASVSIMTFEDAWTRSVGIATGKSRPNRVWVITLNIR